MKFYLTRVFSVINIKVLKRKYSITWNMSDPPNPEKDKAVTCMALMSFVESRNEQ